MAKNAALFPGPERMDSAAPVLASPPADDTGKMKLRKSIGLVSSITIIVGSVIGSGIFISPGGILRNVHSFGASIIIWVTCGLFNFFGMYCYAELGTMMPLSGGDYSYVLEAFGPLIGFLRLWIEVMVARPTSTAVISMVFAKYILQPIFPTCDGPDIIFRLLAVVCVATVGFFNCLSVRAATRIQDFFTFAKVAALIAIIITGLVQIGKGQTESFEDSFEGSNWSPSSITLAFYSGLFAYSGGNYLNCMYEEMENAARDLPLAIVISCLLITAIYTMANVAYVTVLTVHEVLTSSAVAVDFATRVYGPVWWLMPIFVAFSTFGGANGTIMTTSRIFFVASREKQMPQLLSFLHCRRVTPIPAVVFTCILTIIYILVGNVDSLITYLGFVQWFAIGVSILIVIVFRFTRPNIPRPVKSPVIFAYIFDAVVAFLVIFTFIGSPTEALIGLGIIITGIPVYIFGCLWKKKPKSFVRFMYKITIGSQKLLQLIPGE